MKMIHCCHRTRQDKALFFCMIIHKPGAADMTNQLEHRQLGKSFRDGEISAHASRTSSNHPRRHLHENDPQKESHPRTGNGLEAWADTRAQGILCGTKNIPFQIHFDGPSYRSCGMSCFLMFCQSRQCRSEITEIAPPPPKYGKRTR